MLLVVWVIGVAGFVGHSHHLELEEQEPWDGEFEDTSGVHSTKVDDRLRSVADNWIEDERDTAVELRDNKLNGQPMVEVNLEQCWELIGNSLMVV